MPDQERIRKRDKSKDLDAANDAEPRAGDASEKTDQPRLTPAQIVAELDKFVVGQTAAKRAVAVALRNRDRRRALSEDLRKEIMPKNILMIGPTGVGKTEIARRVAALVGAPFVKVEATRFTEVGYVGRDVDSIIRELADSAVDVVHKERATAVSDKAESLANERLADYLCQQYPTGRISKAGFKPSRPQPAERLSAIPSLAVAQAKPAVAPAEGETPAAATVQAAAQPAPALTLAEKRKLDQRRRRMARLLARKSVEDAQVEVEMPDEFEGFDSILEFGPGMNQEEMYEDFQDFVSRYQSHSGARYRRVSVKEARRILAEQETERLIDHDAVVDDAIDRVEEMGVVFLDELDKITGPDVTTGPDVSGEGVQRDLLPIVEGSSVTTRYGPVHTDHILFIAAGAFYKNKPSDLLPELQGRFPLRVELKPLTQDDFVRILQEPQNALTRQYQALLGADDIKLEFSEDALQEIARFACLMNDRSENIGARRLATIMERLLEDVSFDAPAYKDQTLNIDAAFVRQRIEGITANEDISKYIL
jgi:ATP-dependent HslUV protease ATP-binding subunit HslU